MSRIAILSPTTLLGAEVREALGRIEGLAADVVLLSAEDEEVGTVTEVAGSATVVSRAEALELEGIDLLVSCGLAAHDQPFIDARPAGATALVAAPGTTPDRGIPVVASLNPEAIEPGGVLISPHPVAVALAHLLAPLERFAPQSATATAILPVSHLGEHALDGLLEQTRQVLAMTGERPDQAFGRQLAFNLFPAVESEGVAGADRTVPELVSRVTGLELPLAVRILQGPVFHGVALSLFVELGEPPGIAAVGDALSAGRPVTVELPEAADETTEEPWQAPGPVEAAVRSTEVIVGSIEETGFAVTTPSGGRVYSIWAVMDNLIMGGAENVAEIAVHLLGGRLGEPS